MGRWARSIGLVAFSTGDMFVSTSSYCQDNWGFALFSSTRSSTSGRCCTHALAAHTQHPRARTARAPLPARDARSWRCELTCQWCAVLLTGNLNWQLRRCGLRPTSLELSRRTSSSTAGDVGVSQHHYYITLPSPDGTPSHLDSYDGVMCLIHVIGPYPKDLRHVLSTVAESSTVYKFSSGSAQPCPLSRA